MDDNKIFTAEYDGTSKWSETEKINRDYFRSVEQKQQQFTKKFTNTQPTLSLQERKNLTDISVKLFLQTVTAGNNTLISPVSIISALAMAANGANGITLVQMENLFQMPIWKLDECMNTYMKAVPEGAKIANSIWIRDNGNKLNEDFKKLNEKCYKAKISKAAFDDGTLNEINQWVKENTDGMVEKILGKINTDDKLYLINAVAFNSQWDEIYKAYKVIKEKFTKENGVEQDVEMMYSKETDYLCDENAEGFLKYYKDCDYAFAAILPNLGMTVEEYLSSLTGEKLYSFLHKIQKHDVYTAIPKFKSSYNVELCGKLKRLGVKAAFSDEADFSGMCTEAVKINQMLHKTLIEVDEKGTRAAAITFGDMKTVGCIMQTPRYVYLNRPFIYMILDTKNKIPLFIGTQMNIKG